MFYSKNFMKYVVISLVLTAISTVSIVFLVDYMGLWVGYANLGVVAVIFIIRYIMYDKTGMLTRR